MCDRFRGKNGASENIKDEEETIQATAPKPAASAARWLARFDQEIQSMQFGRLVVLLPIALPCTGKSMAFDKLRQQFEESKAVAFVDRGRILDRALSDQTKLLILVKSSDEYTARKVSE